MIKEQDPVKESFLTSSGTFNNTVRGRILSDLFINTSAERLASVCLSSESFGLFFFFGNVRSQASSLQPSEKL